MFASVRQKDRHKAGLCGYTYPVRSTALKHCRLLWCARPEHVLTQKGGIRPPVNHVKVKMDTACIQLRSLVNNSPNQRKPPMKITPFAAMAVALTAQVNASATSVVINDVATPSGYMASTYTSPMQAEPQTHVIGVYETYSGHSGDFHPGGTAYVHVNGSNDTPINLVLSSYEPTTWILDGDGVGSIGNLLINGYYKSTVQGIDSGKIIDKTGIGSYLSACAYKWPGDDQGCDTAGLVQSVEAQFGTPITSFSGTYRATDFSVSISAVPEASTALYLMLGLPVAAWAIQTNRRRRTD